jgi:hypothetical protein
LSKWEADVVAGLLLDATDRDLLSMRSAISERNKAYRAKEKDMMKKMFK